MKRYLYKFLFLTVIFFSHQNAFSQKDYDNYYYGEFYLKEEKFEEALNFFLMIHDSSNAYVQYLTGKCYFNIREKRTQCIPYFFSASQKTSIRKDEVNFESGYAPVDVFYYLGEAWQRENKIDSAFGAFMDYKGYISEKDRELLAKVNFKIQSIAYAKQLLEHPLSYKELNLGSVINTRFSDYNPVVSKDEKTLIFTSYWESVDLIFMSRFMDGKWTKSEDITSQTGSDGTFYTSCLSADGTELYLVKQSDFDCDIYISYFKDTAWTPCVRLSNKINSSSHETSVSLSDDGQKLFFSSNRGGGFGGFDLYCSVKKDGEWEKPVNLGKTINTRFNEEAPFLTSDGKTLFFSSEGHLNMGGMDIFYSNQSDDGTWSKPENVCYPVNTTGDDIFLIPVMNNMAAYYSKYSDKGMGRNDIFRIEFPLDIRKTELLKTLKEEADMTPFMANPEQVRIDSFTIQIMALKNPVEINFFKEIENIVMKKCNDGYFRYISGKFATLKEAEEAVEKIRESGYSDAFIRTFTSIRKKQE